jgi:hypothetical protein
MDWIPPREQARDAALNRDDHTCRECGADRDDAHRLEAHHVRPSADGGPDAAANLITLCARCHRDKHTGRATYYDSEFRQTITAYGPMSTGEVADWMGCSRTTARRRLSALADAGDVRRVEREGRVVWRAPRSVVGRVLAAVTPFRT